MESILEIQRSLHEERERTIAAMVVENLEKKTSHRDQVFLIIILHDSPDFSIN